MFLFYDSAVMSLHVLLYFYEMSMSISSRYDEKKGLSLKTLAIYAAHSAAV